MLFTLKASFLSNLKSLVILLTPSASGIRSSSFTLTTDSEPKRSKRTKILTSFGEDFFTYLVESDSSSFKEEMESFESPFWKETIESENKSIMENNT